MTCLLLDSMLPRQRAEVQFLPPVATVLVPVREQRSVTVTWCLPVEDPDEWWRAKPDSTVVSLLSSRAQGSLA